LCRRPPLRRLSFICNGKAKVFGTTLGHQNATVADPRYLDLITRGLLWSVDKLDADHLKPAQKVLLEEQAAPAK
jgi:type 1 glutamine amidotransferase